MNSTILAILSNLNNTISNFKEKIVVFLRIFKKIKRTSDKSIVKKLELTLFDY